MAAIIATIMLLAAGFSDPSDSSILASSDLSEMEMELEAFLESEMQGEDIVLDDSLLIDDEAELQEFED